MKVPERYEKYLLVTYSVKGKFLPTPPSGRETANIGNDGIYPRIRIIPLSKVKRPSRKADRRVEVWATFCA